MVMKIRCCALPVVASLLALFVSVEARAKAAYSVKRGMVKDSSLIAVVEITGVEPAQVKGTIWTYQQRAFARVETVIKGEAPKDVRLVLHGEEDFICARCRFSPGRYLVFLRKDGALWVGSNWDLSARPILGGAEGAQTVDWFEDDRGIDTKAQPLDEVLADVKKLVAAKTD